MGRNAYNPFPSSRHSASRKRGGNAHLQQSPRSNVGAAIDQRLIEGAQSSMFANRALGIEPETYNSGPSFLPHEEDLQYDAFDLELLAQSDEPANSHTTSSNTDTRSLSYGPLPRGASNQVSRFFRDPHVTPHQSVGSNSSDIDLRSPFSPLSRLQAGRAVPFRGQNLESGRAHQTKQQEEPSSYSNYEAPFDSPQTQPTPFQNTPLSIRGIVLVSVRELPDNYRSIFPFPVFNAVQSKCFQAVYKGSDNIVLAAPTGSGKTVVMELAICRLLSNLKDERFKVIYQAPTKSLCSERFRDWNRKFHALGLQCAELTGDTDYTQLRNVQNSQIIITTPEKWDSMTRKWKDHARLMQLVKLFLIDEVHILKEARGATLEAVVSRMKTIGSNVRFVALSATIPNSEDIATWLGKDATNQHVPARREHFGEEFRPVKLQKFVYGYQSHGNDFAFDKMCSSKLPDILATHSCKKPVMIFCCTRNSSVATAKELTRLWSMSNPPARLWKGPSKPMEVHNTDLKATTAAGVAFHHAGLDPADRHVVETGFLQGQINIICCTSTLAVGVNLPCHLVIVKNTVGWQDGGCKEYSDLEIMQMLGRAGRPQFDDSAVAVILTRKERAEHYETLVSGSESLESCLHLNLIDHLNAEIGLGNITDIESAIRWLAGTFLFVRLRRNPTHYQLKEGSNRDDEDDMLRQICEKDIRLLQESGLVAHEQLKSTQFGDAMARYYIRFETMKNLLTVKPRANMSQILSVISQAEEFRGVRLKAGEKSLYKEINLAQGICFPVKVDIALPAHKISLLLQSELGAVEFPDGEQFQKHKFSFQQDKNFVFSHINRLIRCVIDCQIFLEDSVAVRNALDLARSFGAKVWDKSPLQMKQIEQIGVVAVRKLAAAGITSIEALELTEAHLIDMILSKNPPFGMKLLGRLADFPKPLVSVKVVGKDIKTGNPVRVRFKADVAFMNEKCPVSFQRRPVYVCFLAETSDGRLVDFRRISASKLKSSHEILLSAEMKNRDQYIKCHVMCDDIAGTLKSAEIKPELPSSLFPARTDGELEPETGSNPKPQMNTSRPRSNNSAQIVLSTTRKTDTFDSDDLLFDDFLEADQMIDWAACNNKGQQPPGHRAKSKPTKESEDPEKPHDTYETEPTRLENGRWACNHKCKDKTMCKHFCCRGGLEKPPKPSKKQPIGGNQRQTSLNQLTLSASISKKDANAAGISQQGRMGSGLSGSKQRYRPQPSSLEVGEVNPKCNSEDKSSGPFVAKDLSSDYEDDSFVDLPSPSALLGNTFKLENQDHGKATKDTSAEHDIMEIEDWIYTDVLTAVDSPTQKVTRQDAEHDAYNLVKKSSGDTVTAPRANVGNPGSCLNDAVLINSSSPDVSCGQKRQLALPDQRPAHNDKKTKRTKTGEETKNYPANQENYNAVVSSGWSQDGQPSEISKLPAVPKDWEDIDPALLDEFKDIVNFF